MKPGKPLQRKTLLARAPFKARPPAKPKTKKCAAKGCHERYEPDPKQPFRVWCSEACAHTLALARLAKQKESQAKAERKQDQAKRASMKTIPQIKEEAQKAFNAYIRARDLAAGHGCICCGKFATAAALAQPGGAYDACHFRSRGSADHLRYDERNCHLGLKDCNTYGHMDYRGGLIRRIGLEAVEALEADNTGRKWTREYLEGIKTTYRAKLRELQKSR